MHSPTACVVPEATRPWDDTGCGPVLPGPRELPAHGPMAPTSGRVETPGYVQQPGRPATASEARSQAAVGSGTYPAGEMAAAVDIHTPAARAVGVAHAHPSAYARPPPVRPPRSRPLRPHHQGCRAPSVSNCPTQTPDSAVRTSERPRATATAPSVSPTDLPPVPEEYPSSAPSTAGRFHSHTPCPASCAP